MSKIFIGYRHDDGGHAMAIYQHLRLWFDEQDLFIDHERLASGEKFRPALEKAVSESKLFLAVIGQHWFSDKNRQRLDDPDDVTRGELRTAVSQGIPIIPLPCGGATLPEKSELPADIAPFCDGHHHPIPVSEYFPALNRLIDQLRDTYGFEPRYRPPHGVTQVVHLGDQKLSRYFSDPVDNLGRLHRLLTNTGTAAVVGQATLQGMGGVGKTQLALKYCTDYQKQYAGVWWFKAESLLQLQQDWQQFCAVNKIAITDGELPHRAGARFLRHQPRWLLVSDNAEAEYGDEKAHISPYLPGGGHHIIITARSPELGDAAETIPLDVWTEEQALPFLQQRLPGRNEAELRLLCTTLGGLPLALEQACAYLLKTGSSISPYCAAIEDRLQSEKFLDKRDSQHTDYPLSVMATLSLAFDKLSPAAQELLRLCAWCAPEPIPELLFYRNSDSLPDALRRTAANELDWGETIAELTGYALAQRITVDLTPPGESEPVGDQALLLHRLTQKVVIHHLCPNTCDASILTNLISLTFPKEIEVPSNWPLCNCLSPHLLHLTSISHQISLPLAQMGTLLNSVAQYFRHRMGLYAEAGVLFEQSFQLSSNLFGPDHPNTLISKNNLASTLWDLGNLEGAQKLQREVLERREELLGFDNPDTLTSMNNLAATLKAMGDLNGAKTLQEQVLERSKAVFGQDHPNTLTSVHNLASVLYDMGDYEEAKELEEQVLIRRTELFGPNHPDTLASMSNLAEVLKDTGQSEKANELRIRVFEGRVGLFGIDHPDTLSSMNSLAETLWDLGEKQRSRSMLEQVLTSFRKRLGPQHPKTTTSAWSLFSILHNMKDHAAAQEVIHEHLAWLLADDVELHSGAQQQIRDRLRQLVGVAGEHDAE